MKKIQLVDDGPIIRKLLRKTLEKSNYKVMDNSTTKEFLENFPEFNPDLCLIDINIDDIGDGLILIKAIRNKIGNTLPIIVISSHEDTRDINQALDAGANDYICKPVDSMILLAKVASFLNGANENSLPIFNLPSGSDNTIYLSQDLQIKTINEYGIEFICPDYIYQNTYINISGYILKLLGLDRDDIRIKVISTEINKETDQIVSYAQFQEDDEELLNKVRDYIVNS